MELKMSHLAWLKLHAHLILFQLNVNEPDSTVIELLNLKPCPMV